MAKLDITILSLFTLNGQTCLGIATGGAYEWTKTVSDATSDH